MFKKIQQELVIKNCHIIYSFLFQCNKMYYQSNGVSMGSSLGPLLVDIFLIDFENKLLTKLNNNSVVYYKRYVDDIFVIIKNEYDAHVIKDLLNSCCKSIQYTSELENDTRLPFLDTFKNTVYLAMTLKYTPRLTLRK